MEFLQKNARAIIIALLAAGVVVAISASGDTNNEEASNQESSEVASQDEQQGPVAPETEPAEEAIVDEEAEKSADEVVSPDEAIDTTEKDNGDVDHENTSDDEHDTTEHDESKDTDSGDVVRENDTYTVSAVAGDSQTTMMRRLISQYESENNVELSPAQMLYAETNLVDDIGQSDAIEVGDEINLTGSDIKKRVEEARNLDEQTLALWERYL